MNRQELERRFILQRELRIRSSRISFWDYCKTIAPDFYKENRDHLKTLCDTLQGIYEKRIINKETGLPYRKLMINMPPRFGKSRTLILFSQWIFGINQRNKIISCSYSEDLAVDFSRAIRDTIQEEKTEPHEVVFNEIFSDTKIKEGNASFRQWALEGSHFSFKGTGIQGSVTGKGCNIGIIDDPIKSEYEANNEKSLSSIYKWYSGTFLQRLEGDYMLIINMTRWSSNDLCGVILNNEEEAKEWFVLKLEAYNEEEDELLCPSILDMNKYNELKRNVNEAIFRANYHQEPVDLQGRLYKELKEYEKLPDFKRIIAYVDTADTGSDFLCMIIAAEFEKELYILDVYYTQDDMSITEKKTAEILNKTQLKFGFPIDCHIESNNGGRTFARTVERILYSDFKNRKVNIKWFTQNKNKHSRIISHASFVQNHVYFPLNWKGKFRDFYDDIYKFQSDPKANKHDDCADVLTGICEVIEQNNFVTGFSKRDLGL